MNFRSLILSLYFLFIILPAISQVSEFDTELKILRHLEIMEFREKIPLLYDSLRKVPDYESRIEMGNALFDLTEKIDPAAHIHSLLFRASISKKNSESLFNLAYNLAENYGNIDDINNVEHSRAVYYMNKRQYDSAMVFILRYREKVGPDITGEGYREINNLLGDIYYHAGLFDKAREIYCELLHQYELEENWNYFRPYVMMNNIGQIFLKDGNISKAHEEFNRSLKLAEDHLKTPYRNNTIGYIKIKLAETALANNNVDEAEKLLNEVADYPKSDIHEDVKQEWIFNMARLLLEQGKPNDAKQYAEQLTPEGKQLYSEYRFVPEVYHLLAEIYSDLGLYEMAMNYDRKFDDIKDSLRISKHLTSSMIVIADYNERLTKQELDKTQQRTSFIIKIFVILIISIILLVF